MANTANRADSPTARQPGQVNLHSGGLTIRGHILGKDGIFACALVVEMLARTGQKISQLRERVYSLTGRLYQAEETIPATPEMRIAVPRRLREASGDRVAQYPVERIS